MILLEREKLLSELEQKIGYSFRSRALLDRALTHRSFANERVAQHCQHNEAMEFLGDSVLGFVVSAWLLERFPELSEGKLSKIKAHLVSEASLVELAEEIDLGRYILLNRGEEKTGGRRKRALLADAYEALIGVVYIDGSITVAERFLRRELRDKLTAVDPSAMIGTDYKSALQEKLQAMGGLTPEYAVIGIFGPDHRRTFRIELRVTGRALAQAEGSTIKVAQQEAARRALAEPDTIAAALAEPHEPEVLDESASEDCTATVAASDDASDNDNTTSASEAGPDEDPAAVVETGDNGDTPIAVAASDHQEMTAEVAASDNPDISAAVEATDNADTTTEVEASDNSAASDNQATPAEAEAIAVTPLSELDGDAPLFAVNEHTPLDLDVDEPLRAIADEIEAARKANGAGGNSIDAACEPTDAAREPGDNIELNEEASRGATTEA